jgi:hypothetical protein
VGNTSVVKQLENTEMQAEEKEGIRYSKDGNGSMDGGEKRELGIVL